MEQNAHIQRFREACEQKGLKVTHQRLEIYRSLAESEAHPDAETVYARVRDRIPTISLDTVYRNLKLLAEHEIIAIVGMSHERTRFDANLGVHHHFVCTVCGAIADFTSVQFDRLQAPKEAYAFGIPQSIQVEVKGVCIRCHEKRNEAAVCK